MSANDLLSSDPPSSSKSSCFLFMADDKWEDGKKERGKGMDWGFGRSFGESPRTNGEASDALAYEPRTTLPIPR